MYALFSIIIFALVVGALVDIITRDEWQVRHLPKMVWIILVVLLPLIGSIIWFAVGHDYSRPVDLGSFGDPRRHETLGFGPAKSTEQELADLDREIAFHEKQAEIERLESKLNQRRATES